MGDSATLYEFSPAPVHGQVYDSARIGRPVVRELREFWAYRRLFRVLVARDISVKYRRSFLGMWWALLTPLLRMLVMWIVLSQIFKAQPIGVPYIVYLLSGVVVFTFFEQAMVGAGSSIVNSSGLLSKVHVPAHIFAVSAVVTAATTFALSLIPLAAIQLATGVGIPWTWVLLPIPFLGLASLAAGVGLIVASAAVRYYDAIDLTVVLVGLLAFLTPTFYPLESISPDFQVFIQLNPLTEILAVMRSLFFNDGAVALWQWAVCLGSGAVALVTGMIVFSRGWRSAAVML